MTGNKELREALHEVNINSPCVVTNIIGILSVYLLLPVLELNLSGEVEHVIVQCF